MPADLRTGSLALLGGWVSPTPAQELLRLRFLDYLTAHDDGMWRSSAPAHLTASAVVLDASRERVALLLHRKVGRWLQPGGHCEVADATLLDAALREATEETGIAGLAPRSPEPIDLDVHGAACRRDTDDQHFDVRFAFVAPVGAQLVFDQESLGATWFLPSELPEPDDESITRLIAAALAV